MSKTALLYALAATLTSVALQTAGNGILLAQVSAAARLAPWKLLVLVLPHASLELTAVFLPLALFLRQAKAGELGPLDRWALQAVIIAVPALVLAAGLEVFLAPALIAAA